MRRLAVGVALCVLSLPGPAAAAPDSTEPTMDIQLFYPAPGVGGFLSVESGDVNSFLGVNAGLVVNYARNPLAIKIIREDGSQEDVGAVVENRIDFDIFGAIGLFDHKYIGIDLGIVMPLILQGGFAGDAFSALGIDAGTTSIEGFTQGDLRLFPKFRLLKLEDGILTLAIIGGVVVPTAGGADYVGENSVMIQPAVALSSRTGIINLGLNVGYRIRDRTKVQTFIVDHEIFYKLAGSIDIAWGEGKPMEIIAEVYGHTPADHPWGLGIDDPNVKQFQKARTPLEIDIGIRATFLDSIKVYIAGGGGLMPGYGSPAPRVMLGAQYFTSEAGPQDEDGDGVEDTLDKCPKRKEDRDGFEDDDGCPEFDNDKDNILDEDDQCLNEPEDRDGFEDEDGCPESDNDNDGLLDADDQCPNEAEDPDGFEDEDGCPDLDNDGDQIADAVDKCPMEPEDRDGFKDSDGCPDPDNDEDGLPDLNDLCPNHAEDKDGVADDDGCPEDNDGDGIPDAEDKCPNKPESYNGIDDEDGCPEKLKVKSLVEVTEEKIEIKEKVFFKTGSATILSKSFGLLDQVASVLKNYKHLTVIEVQGHTDSRGSKKKNKKLSRARAQAVRQYLIDKGIDAARLKAKGYGPDLPIASNKTGRGREMNRRVEFVIVDQKPIGEDVSEGLVEEPPPPPPGGEGIDLDFMGGGGEEAPEEEAPEETPTEGEGGGEIQFEF